MGLALERRNVLTAHSDRVKCVDFHPTEPWVLVSLYSGVVNVWDYQTQSLIKTIEVCDSPVRTAKFIARKNWIITGSDDLVVRVFNYNTLEKVAQIDGHTDYVRSFAIHPSKPFVLSCSDDMTIKLWDWERGWKCQTTFEGHVHYVMGVAINPKDSNTFATASLDNTIKVWSFNASTPNYTLEGHEKGVNSVAYYMGGDRPYLVTGSDDMTVRVWDYQNKSCVRVLEGHTQNVSCAIFHPDLPIIISGAEDGVLKIWNSNTFRVEASYNFALDRIWSVACIKGSTEIAVGCDEGALVFQLGKGEPAASMDANGKLIWARRNEILSGNVRQVLEDEASLADGQRLTVSGKELGHCDIYPQTLAHSPNGRYVVVCGDGEYIIYTALAWRNKTFGKAFDLAWASGGNDYAVRESASKLTIFQNFSESGVIRIDTSCDALFGGKLIGAACAGGQLCFFDWNTCQLVRRIDVEARKVFWAESGDKVAIGTDQSLYILQYHEKYVQAATELPADGVEEAFEVLNDLSEKITSGLWVGDCFIFMGATNRIAYIIGDQVYQLAVAERPVYIVGYLPKENSLILVDKDASVVKYELALAVVEYESAILRGDVDTANTYRDLIPTSQHNRVAQFLESQGMNEEALAMATDPELKFSLALKLKKFDVAYELASQQSSTIKWRQLGDVALAEFKIALAEKCLLKSEDLSSLLLLYASMGNSAALATLGTTAAEQGQLNIAFSALFLSGHLEECFDLMLRSQRYPEAALFARTYLPSAIDRAVTLWRADLRARNSRAANLIASFGENPQLFGNLVVPDSSALPPPTSALPQQFATPMNRSRAPSIDSTGNDHLSQGSFGAQSQPVASPAAPFEVAYSDHMSLEVNTGTGSMRADDLDDVFSASASDGHADAFVSSTARAMGKLLIHEGIEEENAMENDPAPEVDPSLQESPQIRNKTVSGRQSDEEPSVPVYGHFREPETTPPQSASASDEYENLTVPDRKVQSQDPQESVNSPEIEFDDDGWD